ncbi:hypothetical protein HDU92_004231 [Lobulomyces angularis]|nr:hypothetical protein HDU92_004231 [Lobulomyces angularis]
MDLELFLTSSIFILIMLLLNSYYLENSFLNNTLDNLHLILIFISFTTLTQFLNLFYLNYKTNLNIQQLNYNGLKIEKKIEEKLKPIKAKLNNPYKEVTDKLVETILENSNLDLNPPKKSYNFETIVEKSRGDYNIVVEKKKDQEFFYRVSPIVFPVIVDLESTPEAAFDLLADINKRKEWDEVVTNSGVIEEVVPGVKIQYLKTKAIWPTAGRDALVVAVTKKVNEKLINVTTSIPSHPAYKADPNYVRMQANIAGIVCFKHPTKSNLTRCVQIIDGDLKGWIPKAIVALVTTKAFPISLGRVNKILLSKEKTTISQSILESQQLTADVKSPNETVITDFKEDQGCGEKEKVSIVRKNDDLEIKQTGSGFGVVHKFFIEVQPFLVFGIFVLSIVKRKNMRI